MKTIYDITDKHINEIYSIIVNRTQEAIKVDRVDESGFIIAIFKIEECVIDKRYENIEYGIYITPDLEVKYVWHYKNKKETVVEYKHLSNHHKVTKYMIDKGFDIFGTSK